MAEDRQNKELNTFGFTGKLRTGLVTAIIAIQFAAIVTLWRYTVSQSKDKEAIQKELYEKMIERLDSKVNEKMTKEVTPRMERLDTVTSRLDTATTQLQEKINVRQK
ncbi:hypothetical protein FKG96_12485 [Olivibacter sp. LS-1]|uniref:hypothetical protein n=1 Tax=Olivibacter sp. LS-1 TaxID=2592345 RepID=UPI0011EAF7EF|nr:hypothetical protein [Olivibacter sp. LS-1]QEL01589.1 hypothetical protein FKG96_12485 [Olivibacter sp. LS-1]